MIRSRKTLRARRLIISYDVTVESDAGDHWERKLLGIHPVDPDFVERELRELCRAVEGHPTVEPFHSLVTYVEELRLAVHFFPVDLALPAMATLTRPQSGAALAPYLPQCRNGSKISRVDAELKHYKPVNRCVLRLVAHLTGPHGEQSQQAVYVKIFADNRGAAIYNDMKALWEATRDARALHIPEPLGYDSQRRMLVMEAVAAERDLTKWIKCIERGQPLPDGVDLKRLSRCMVIAAESLAELHRAHVRPRLQRTFQSELANCRKDLELLRHVDPDLAKATSELLQRLEALALKDEPLVPSHGGYRHKQTVGNDHRLTVIDWDGLSLAHPALDAANFISRLRQEPLRRPGEALEMEQLADVFRHELLSREPGLDPRELALYEALSLMEKTLRSFRRPLGAEANEQVRRMLDAVRTKLNEACGQSRAPA
jgi:aminoglycoside phosphotransferase (APT) family kinase protein